MTVLLGMMLGFCFWFVARYAIGGFYTIGPNERAVLCTFGRAQRLGELSTLADPLASELAPDERERYNYPQVRVIGPGFYWKLPWQSLHRASVATATVSIGFDPESPKANAGGHVLEAVTKDQLNTGLSGQLRYTVTERNLYAFLFGVKNPVAHVMGYFVSILRNRIANFEAPGAGRDRALDPAGADTLGEVQGANRVNVIRSAAEREAAIEFAKAAATRPQIVGKALAQIAQTPGIVAALFEVLEAQNMLANPELSVNVVPAGAPLLYTLGAPRGKRRPPLSK